MVDRTLDWAGVTSVKSVVDVGCGIGGSSRHIAQRFKAAHVRGVTLSPRQVLPASKGGRSRGAMHRAFDFIRNPSKPSSKIRNPFDPSQCLSLSRAHTLAWAT